MYSEKLSKRKLAVELQITQMKKELEKLPTGKLRCERNGRYVKWFNKHNGTEEYIPKKCRNLAEQLAIRKYKEMLIKELQVELDAINAFLRIKNKGSVQASKLLDEDSCYKPLLASYFNSHDKTVQKWLEEPYAKNTAYPENLIHKTVAGIMVRSKSEALIVSALYQNHVPFRYECPLYLDAHTVYPDFTILHPRTKKIFYWEHFGKMDNQEYISLTNKKIKSYFENGINPANNLIMTFESSVNPLDYEVVDEIIRLYLS